jgi:hypothetical protein
LSITGQRLATLFEGNLMLLFRIRIALLGVLAAGLASALAAPLAAQTLANPNLPEWLAGTWVMEDGAQWADEVWTDPRGGMLLGLSRTGFGPQLQGWEVMQIRRKADGRISFCTQPQGQAPVEFPLVLISAEAIEFANPANEYPQRVRYWRQGKLLMFEVSRLDGSAVQRANFRPVVTPQDE